MRPRANDVIVKCRHNGTLGIMAQNTYLYTLFFFFARNYIAFEIGVWLYYI